MRVFFIFIFSSIILSQDISEGYTIYTPGGGPGGGNDPTTYLRDIDNTVINTWSHGAGPASI